MTGGRLRADGLRLFLGERQLLDGVDLEADGGEMVAVTGPSGAGKSTLLLVLAGVLRPDEGAVAYSTEAGVAPVIALVPQTLALAASLTAAENVALPVQVRGCDAKELQQRVAASLEAVGLGAASDRLVTELSGGQRQRVAVARALAMRPDVIIADEATAELDGENQRIVMDLLEEEAARGTLLVLATHDSLVAERCRRTYQLDSGHLVAASSTAGTAG
ncbi:MAG TPA: ATP-binding cassette domain-containing protein [Acidimicrobiales bacterium]|nr:ATP-binding cassette domain-containing protein [Acidimicrobiales bacterium]